MKHYRIFVGTQGDTGPVPESALDTVRDELVTLFGGLTESHARGLWRGQDGKLWDESSLIWDVFSDPAQYWNHREYAQRLCARLGQQAILVQTSEGGELIYAS